MTQQSKLSNVDVSAGMRSFRFSPRFGFLLGLVAASLAVFSKSLVALLQLAWRTDEYTHVLLVLPVSLALIYLERRYATAKVAPSPTLGAMIAAAAGTIPWFAWERGIGNDASLALNIAALVLCCIAAVIAIYGVAVARSLMFPLLFLFLIVPLPASLLEKTVVVLQTASTEATFALFKLAGVPVIKHGFILSLPSLNIEVAKQCSGIRSSIILLVTCLVLAHVFLRSAWSKFLFVLFVLPIAIAKNAIRIFTLSILGIYVNPDFLEGHLHHDGGIVFFSLALVTLFLLIKGLQQMERKISPNLA
jgi:exosortase